MATLFVENLTVVDFSYLHAKRGMVGESWIVDLELSGDLDAQGMVFDFGHIKKALKQAVDERVDHRLLLPGESDLLGLHRVMTATSAWSGATWPARSMVAPPTAFSSCPARRSPRPASPSI